MPNIDIAASGTRPNRGGQVAVAIVQYTALVTAPDNGSSTTSTALTINAQGFDSAGGNVNLVVELATVSDFSSVADSATFNNVATASVQVWNKTGLTLGTRYYLRARASNTGNTVFGPYSPSIYFIADDRAADSYVYFYENVGANPAPSPDSYYYFYENVGLSFVPSQDDDFYGYVNVGVNVPQVNDNQYYLVFFNTTTTPNPQIWFLFPSTGSPGGSFNVVGHGFGDLQSTYTGEVDFIVAGSPVALSVTSWQTFPASPLAFSLDRAIDPVNVRDTSFSDNFDVNASTLGTGWLYAGQGTWTQSAGQAVPPNVTADMYAYRVFASADGILSLTVPDSTNAAGVLFRYSDTNNYWAWEPYQRVLLRKVAGSSTTVASGATLGSVPSAGSNFAVALASSTITLFVNSVQVFQVTGATQLQTNTSHGMYATRGANRFDSFSYSSPVSPGLAADPQHGEITVTVPTTAVPPGYNTQVRTNGP